MKREGLRACATVALAVFLAASLLVPGRAAAEYRDKSGDLPFGGGAGLALVAVGVAVTTLVVVLLVKRSGAKPPEPEGAAPPPATSEAPYAPLSPDLRPDALALAGAADPGAAAVRFAR